MPASQGIQKHASRMALLCSNAKMICRLFKIAMFMELNGLGDMFIGRQTLIAAIGASCLGSDGAF